MWITSEIRGLIFGPWCYPTQMPFTSYWTRILSVTLSRPHPCTPLCLLHIIMNVPSYRIRPHCLEACHNHWWNITIGIWYPRWITKRRPNQLGLSTTIFYVPSCVCLSLRVLPFSIFTLGFLSGSPPLISMTHPPIHMSHLPPSLSYLSPCLSIPEFFSHFPPPPNIILSSFRAYPYSRTYHYFLSVSMLNHSHMILLIQYSLPHFSPLALTLFLSNILCPFPYDLPDTLFPRLNSDCSTYARLWSTLITRIRSDCFTPTSSLSPLTK